MGVKWSFMPKQAPGRAKPMYLAVNADRERARHPQRSHDHGGEPDSAIEGCIISLLGIGANKAFIYVRDELHLSKARLWGAIKGAAEGLPGEEPVRERLPDRHRGPHRRRHVHLRRRDRAPQLARGETRRAAPQAAVPAQAGAFGCPTTVNNLETTRESSRRLRDGLREVQPAEQPPPREDGGCRLYGSNGHVKKPQVIELAVGRDDARSSSTTSAAASPGDRESSASSPGGSSTPPLRAPDTITTPDEKSPRHQFHGMNVLDVPLGRRQMRAAGHARHLLRPPLGRGRGAMEN